MTLQFLISVMFFMDNKGQAFSAFKLLIAAIVAIALLGVLMPIITQTTGLIKTDPSETIGRAINGIINSPGSISKTDNLTFSPKTSVAVKAIASKAGLDKSQICVSLGTYEENPDSGFTTMDGTQIAWNGSTDKSVKAYVVCDLNPSDLMDTIEGAGKVAPESCECLEEEKCCAVILTPQ
jgi:uncharacterized protein (UPF0333 family)